jgi:hypothetical protein
LIGKRWRLYLDIFRQADGVLNVDAAVTHRGFQFAVTQQQLASVEIAGLFVWLAA